jgi:solute carrier family 25 carnitine/acylcarnitine transporter 20/29
MWFGKYRGMGPPLVGVTPIFALSFWSYDLGKKLIYAATPNRTDKNFSLTEFAAAGFFSAVPTTLVAGPAERVKVLLQVSFLLQSSEKGMKRGQDLKS